MRGARAVPRFVGGDFLDALEDGVHVARVAQVFEPDSSRAVRLFELRARLGDLIKLEPFVEVDLQLRHGLLRLLHAHDVDAPVRQVFRESRVGHHVVLVGGVRVHVGARRCDRAELDRERVLLPGRLTRVVVAQRAAVAAAAIPVLTSGADVAVGEVEPQVLRDARLGASPAFGIGRDLAALAWLLRQRRGVPRRHARLLPRRHLFLLVEAGVREDRVDARGDHRG